MANDTFSWACSNCGNQVAFGSACVHCMQDVGAKGKVQRFAKNHRNNVTAWEPSPGDIRVFDWSCHTLLAKGSNWDSVAESLGLK